MDLQSAKAKLTTQHEPQGRPFGTRRLPAWRNFFRQLSHRLPPNYFGRRGASLLLGLAGGRNSRPVDVEIFEGQRARLHPKDNICEKRVFSVPQLWDARERAILAADIAASTAAPYIFLDIGANAGLYTLFCRGAAITAGKRLKAICIEPDPEMRARMAFNVHASNAADDVRIFPYAVSDERKRVGFAINAKSRGLNKISPTGTMQVQAAPLAEILRAEAGISRIDSMKIDIEGGEYIALKAFFENAPATLLPTLIIMEHSHDSDGEDSALNLCLQHGYREQERTRMNTILRLGPRPYR